jgi:hypothetical protein
MNWLITLGLIAGTLAVVGCAAYVSVLHTRRAADEAVRQMIRSELGRRTYDAMQRGFDSVVGKP